MSYTTLENSQTATPDTVKAFRDQLKTYDFTCIAEQNSKMIHKCGWLSDPTRAYYLVEDGQRCELYLGQLGVTSTAKLVFRCTAAALFKALAIL